MTLVYLDTETTGLDPDRHQVWEIAYAVDDGPTRSEIVFHHLNGADDAALAIGGHEDRCQMYSHPGGGVGDFTADLRESLTGATLVGANPAFDAAFLRARWGETPWRYRLFDIEVYAMGALGLDEPRGLAYIADRLGVQAPDHTAAGDVHTLRECHRTLRRIYIEKAI